MSAVDKASPVGFWAHYNLVILTYLFTYFFYRQEEMGAAKTVAETSFKLFKDVENEFTTCCLPQDWGPKILKSAHLEYYQYL